ncbi:hypothetical protein B14911_08195 [Bacillus sp. NRRL B-14911]|nr:hypothetical protein B14911_08195 [Bacillus sp. NRRL B-14911]
MRNFTKIEKNIKIEGQDAKRSCCLKEAG